MPQSYLSACPNLRFASKVLLQACLVVLLLIFDHKKKSRFSKLEVASRKGSRRIKSLQAGKVVWESDVMFIAVHVGEDIWRNDSLLINLQVQKVFERSSHSFLP